MHIYLFIYLSVSCVLCLWLYGWWQTSFPTGINKFSIYLSIYLSNTLYFISLGEVRFFVLERRLHLFGKKNAVIFRNIELNQKYIVLCCQCKIFSIITVFSVTWSFRYHSN